MTRASIVPAVLGIAISSVFAEFPVGHWSNKQEGFNVVTFGLRSDGAGYYSACMSQLTTVARWKKDGEAIRMTIAAPPENPTFTFEPTDDPKIGKLKLPGHEPQEFFLMDENEPEDLEGLARARAEKEAANRRKNYVRKETKLKGMTSLQKKVEQFAKSPEGMDSCSIMASGWPTSIQLTRTNKRISVQVNLEEGRAKEQSPNLTYSYRTEEPKTNLPRTIFVPVEKREELAKWAASIPLKHEFAFFQAEGAWGIEGHFAFFSAHIDDDLESVMNVIKYLSNSVFEKEADEFVITRIERAEEGGPDQPATAPELKREERSR